MLLILFLQVASAVPLRWIKLEVSSFHLNPTYGPELVLKTPSAIQLGTTLKIMGPSVSFQNWWSQDVIKITTSTNNSVVKDGKDMVLYWRAEYVSDTFGMEIKSELSISDALPMCSSVIHKNHQNYQRPICSSDGTSLWNHTDCFDVEYRITCGDVENKNPNSKSRMVVGALMGAAAVIGAYILIKLFIMAWCHWSLDSYFALSTIPGLDIANGPPNSALQRIRAFCTRCCGNSRNPGEVRSTQSVRNEIRFQKC